MTDVDAAEMSVSGDPTTAGSVPPPGWPGATSCVPAGAALPGAVGSASRGPAAAPPYPLAPEAAAALAALKAEEILVRAAAATTSEEAAIRWRLRAATFDNALVYVAYAVFCTVVGWNPLTLAHIIIGSLSAFAYHFAFECRDGQTPGKRRYGIRVVAADGGPAGPRAIALRSVLRAVDQLPVSYLSGLVSMLRTGPARRQRIGDLVAHTKVIAVEGRAVSRGTPSWYLPVATMLALVASILVLVTALSISPAQLRPSQTAASIR